MIRSQYPLKLGIQYILIFNFISILFILNNILAYAFTVHKVQGQTINKLLFDIRESVFTHGGLMISYYYYYY